MSEITTYYRPAELDLRCVHCNRPRNGHEPDLRCIKPRRAFADGDQPELQPTKASLDPLTQGIIDALTARDELPRTVATIDSGIEQGILDTKFVEALGRAIAHFDKCRSPYDVMAGQCIRMILDLHGERKLTLTRHGFKVQPRARG